MCHLGKVGCLPCPQLPAQTPDAASRSACAGVGFTIQTFLLGTGIRPKYWIISLFSEGSNQLWTLWIWAEIKLVEQSQNVSSLRKSKNFLNFFFLFSLVAEHHPIPAASLLETKLPFCSSHEYRSFCSYLSCADQRILIQGSNSSCSSWFLPSGLLTHKSVILWAPCCY